MIRLRMVGQGTGRAAMRALARAAFAACCIAGLIVVAQAVRIPAKAALAQVLLNRAFDQAVAIGAPVKPWPWADTSPVARLSVARLGVSDVVLSGGSGEAMAFGPTMLDLQGKSRNGSVIVLAGHRDTHFAWLRDLQPGDVVTLERLGSPAQTYRVRRFETVRWDRFAIPRDPPEPVLLLSTCYPFKATKPGPMRFVAWLEQGGPPNFEKRRDDPQLT
ncbi:MAG: class GN sortase [Novosphingobium sp.]|nr:class GN sortase [Novosphingobium sp.]